MKTCCAQFADSVIRCRWLVLGLAAASVLLGGAAASWASPDEALIVRTVDGRVLAARLDRSTGTEFLVLCWRRSATTITRTVAWDDVSTVELGGVTFRGPEFRQATLQTLPLLGPPPASVRDGWLLVGRAESLPATPAATTSVPAISSPPTCPRLEWLSVEAQLGRWSAAVDPQGLVLCVMPIDDRGQILPVDGVLEVDLIGDLVGAIRPQAPYASIGRWTQRLRPDDFGPQGAVVRLPFQGPRPEFDGRLGTYATVHARLGVAGQGVFEASATPVRVRTANPLRDRLQHANGQRYYPQEATETGQH